MAKEEEAILEELNQSFSRHVPDGRTIARAALRESLSRDAGPTWIKKHFSELVESLQIDAYNRYLRHEERAWKIAFSDVFGPRLRSCKTPDKVSEVIGNHFYTLDRFFLSRTQSRRSRAGTAFEVVLHELLTKLGYPFTFQPKMDGNPDFVMPSIEYYRGNAPDAIVFTAKRTLRERWRQIVTEGARGLGFYLATIDSKVSETQIDEMKTSRIHMVVPAELKKAARQYSAAANVISFEEFLEDHLDPKMAKWKKHRVVE